MRKAGISKGKKVFTLIHCTREEGSSKMQVRYTTCSLDGNPETEE